MSYKELPAGWTPFGVQSPEGGQKVIYHYEWTGTFRGQFTIEDGAPTFGGEHGSIGAEGCYWMPDNGQDITKLSPPQRLASPSGKKLIVEPAPRSQHLSREERIDAFEPENHNKRSRTMKPLWLKSRTMQKEVWLIFAEMSKIYWSFVATMLFGRKEKESTKTTRHPAV